MVESDERDGVRSAQSTSRAPELPGASSNSIELERAADGPRSSSARAARAAPTRRDGEDEELKYGAEHVIRLFVPVSLCMALVITSLQLMKFYSTPDPNLSLAYTPFHTGEDDSTSTRIFSGLGNALIMVCFIVVMTFGLIILYKYECYRLIHGWLMFSSLLLLTAFSSLYISELMRAYNLVVSSPTVLFCLLNYAAMGMICIHWKGPLMMQQAYLISISALMALIFIKLLPDWTAWALLGLISVWDLIAVLSPKGPLHMLVQMSQERNEPIFPALIYSSGILLPYTVMMGVSAEEDEKQTSKDEDETELAAQPAAPGPSGSRSGPSPTSVLIPSGLSSGKRPQVRRVPPPVREEEEDEQRPRMSTASTDGINRPGGSSTATGGGRSSVEEVEERGIKLGLGDFIFYSVLVGKACSSHDWNTILACYVAILVGLCATLLLLALFKKALPALPISISAGLIFYFSTTFLITPFTTRVVLQQLTF